MRFREDRATQAAVHLLARRGGTMSYLKLMKLMYLADRLALQRYGRPLTFDRPVSMPHGPVLSRTLDLITGDRDTHAPPSYWEQRIGAAPDHSVRLLPGAIDDRGALSPAEVAILNEVFDKYGHMTRWELRDVTHELPEWVDPEGSSNPIDLRDILAAGGVSPEDAQAVLDDLAAEAALQRLID